MKPLPLITPIILLALFSCSSGSQPAWEELYNGRDLQGWSVKCLPVDEDKVFWKSVNGYIECNSTGQPGHDYVWLVTDNEYADFHLKLLFQVFQSSPGNSGVQFRSLYDLNDPGHPGGWLNGPQADIHPPDPLRAGLIYDETEGNRRWIHPSLENWEMIPEKAPEPAHQTHLVYADQDTDKWNSLEIIAEGMHIQTIVNDLKVTDFDASGILDDENHRSRNVGTSGRIALQLHSNDELMIRFKDIKIRKLMYFNE